MCSEMWLHSWALGRCWQALRAAKWECSAQVSSVVLVPIPWSKIARYDFGIFSYLTEKHML